MIKKLLFAFALFWAGTTASFAQYPSIGILGTATAVGWDSGDIDMATTDGIIYTLNNVTLTTSILKFRQDDWWTYNWGANSWPTGIGVQNGPDIPAQAGIYNITFNRSTGAYSFVLQPDRIAILGDATVLGWDGYDLDMQTTDGITYTLNNVGLTTGGLKFRQNDDWNLNWGGTAWPSGTGSFNTYGENIPCRPGVYNITFNRQTRAYSFVKQYDLIGIRGAATSADTNQERDIPMSSSDGIHYTLSMVTLTANGLQFRQNDDWPATWGGTQWPSGTAVANLPDFNIPCQPGVYSVAFNKQTLAYSFTYLYPSVGLRGYATSVGWNGPQDIVMNTIDGVHYAVNNVTLAGGGLKFRADNAWDTNWGGYNWPAGTGLVNPNGADIPSQAGVYNITFNRTTREYAFYYVYPTYGLRGSGTGVGWGGDVDILLNTSDGIIYTAKDVPLTAGGLKFRRDNGWTYQWGGTQWPVGTASVGVDGVDIPSQAGTYNVTFNAQTLAYTFKSTTGCFQWTGAVSHDWNVAVNWCSGEVPTIYDTITIPDTANDPVVSSGTAVVYSLIINDAATVTVNSGAVLKVDNKLTVNTGGNLVIENNAALLQNSNVKDNINIGPVAVTRNSAPIFRLDYTLWSSPVAGQTLIGFSPETLPNRFYHYNPLSDAYASVPGSTVFGAGQGYLIRVSNLHPAYTEGAEGTPWTGTFTGVPNNGDVNVTVTPYANPAGTENDVNGYNAVGNPYPSAINIKAFFTANQSNLANNTPIYFWRKKNDAGTSCYASLTLAGYNQNAGNAFGDSSNGVFDDPNDSGNWVINPGQGFIVKAVSNTVSFTNAMRVAVNNGQMFRSTMDEDVMKSRFWLNLTNAEGAFGQTTIAYTPATTLGLDFGWDGEAITDGEISIYSLAGDAKLGIQARPAFDVSDVVPLEYKITTGGTYSISLDHMDGVFSADQDIYLKDNLLGGITHDLKQGPYEFTAEAGVVTGRFDVVYAEALNTNIPAFDAKSMIVYKQGNVISISTGNTDMKSVSVYDVQGRLLYHADNVNAAATAITGLQSAQQMLIVQVQTVQGAKASRKLVF